MFGIIRSGFKKVKKALAKTRTLLGDRLRSLFSQGLKEDSFEDLEKILYEADLGSELSLKLSENLNEYVKKSKIKDPEKLIDYLADLSLAIFMEPSQIEEPLQKEGDPFVILIVGVNGSGKTTTAAKLALQYKEEGKRVLLVAADTFRAAAIEQLEIWSEKIGVDLVKGQSGGDSSAVIFDGIAKAKAKGYDVVIADTAGRLQSKGELMRELEKVRRVIKKQIEVGPHRTYLVLDATTGQNALDQAQIFNEFTPLNGLILTKLDGTSKGGIVLAIYDKMKIPVQYIGLGEKAEDLAPFNPKEYVEALFAK
ncbi:MAG: signal recognition particle-docking protein FtsY [Simkaniaceae bacterium]